MRRIETASTPSSSAIRRAGSTIVSATGGLLSRSVSASSARRARPRPRPRSRRSAVRSRRSAARVRRSDSRSLDTRTAYATVRRTTYRTAYETHGPAVLAEGLVKRFGGTEALAGIDLEMAPGEARGLLGHNGAGKTTAVRILATLLTLDAGRAMVAGRDVVREAAAVRDAIAFAGQQATLDERLTGRENLVLLARLQRMDKRTARARSAELLERLALSEAADRLVSTYSGGMRRRLDLAACLLVARPVVFLDEPTTGLDPVSRAEVWAAVRELADDA